MELLVIYISYKLKHCLSVGGSRLMRLRTVIELGDSRKFTKPIQDVQRIIRLTRPLQSSISSRRLLREWKINARATKKRGKILYKHSFISHHS